VGPIPVETLLFIVIAVVLLWGFFGGLVRRQREWRETQERHRENDGME
jgi:hypothetical protein